MRAELPGHRGSLLAVSGLILLGAVLRLWSLGDGLPHVATPGEWQLADRSLELVRSADWRPRAFEGGALTLYLHTAVTAVRFLAGAVEGVWRGVDQVWAGQFLAAHRLVATLWGLLTIVVVYRLGFRWNAPTALLAGAFAAVSPTLVAGSQTAGDAALVILLVAVSALSAVRAVESGRTADVAVAGLAAGLAAGAAFSGMLALPIALGTLLAGSPAGTRARRTAIVAGGTALAFVVVSPYTLFDLPAFLNAAAGALMERSRRDAIGGLVELWRGIGGALALLPQAWDPARLSAIPGAALLVAGVAGLTRDRARPDRRAAAVAILLTALLYGWAALRGEGTRTAWPAVPALCLALAAGMDAVLTRTRATRGIVRRAAIGVAMLVIAASTARVVAHDWRRAELSPPERLAAWLLANAPPDSPIVIEGQDIRLPPPFTMTRLARLIDWPIDRYRERDGAFVVSRAHIAATYLGDPARFPAEAAAYRALFNELVVVDVMAPDDRRAGEEPTLTLFRVAR